MKKRIVSLLLGVCMVATMFVGCGSSGSTSTDTGKNTEVSNKEQDTEFSTEQSTQLETQDKEIKKPYSAINVTKNSHMPKNVFFQYITGSDCTYEGYHQEWDDFINSEKASDGRAVLDQLITRYWNNGSPAWRYGELLVDEIAYSISYDDETYQRIYKGDEYTIGNNVMSAIYYRLTLVPSYENYESGEVEVIMTFTQKVNDNGSFVWELDGLYSADYISKYFPDLNIE